MEINSTIRQLAINYVEGIIGKDYNSVSEEQNFMVYAYEEGAEHMLDRTCEWLQKHINDYLVHGRDVDLMYDDLRKAMKDGEQC